MKESTKQLLQDVIQFLENNHTGNKEHTDILARFLFHYHLEKDYYEITCVHKDDLKSKYFDVTNVDNDIMIILADKMGDDYCEQLFWSSMEIIAKEYCGIPKIDEEDKSD
jgi:hypothetical protein